MTITTCTDKDAGTDNSLPKGGLVGGLIVVGVDGSASARQALEWAIDEAKLRHGRCEVIEVWTQASNGQLDRWTRRHLLDAHLASESQALSALVEGICADFDGIGSADAELLTGDPVEILAQAATKGELLVIGSGDDGALRRFVAGSVTNALIRHPVGPIVVVPPSAGSRPCHARVVVGVDGSDGSARAARWARVEASRRGCELVVLHAWHMPAMMASPYAPTIAVPYTACQEGAQAILRRAVSGLETGDHPPIVAQLVEGDSEHELLIAAADADLLVIGSRGHGALAATVLGSTSRFCVHHSPCAVAVIP